MPKKKNYIRLTCLLKHDEDEKILKMLNDDRRSYSSFMKDLLYQEYERKKGTIVVIETTTFDKLSGANKAVSPSPAKEDEMAINREEIEDKLAQNLLAQDLLSKLDINKDNLK